MSAALRIGDLIEVPAVRTVIRLDEGRTGAEEIAASFVFTPEVASHVAVIADALMARRGQGYFLQGDFGSGKSHFLAALYAWLAGGEASGMLSERHGGLARLGERGGRLLPVDVSLVNYRASTPLERIVVEAVEERLGGSTGGGGERLETLTNIITAVRRAGFDGLFLLIDELSEFFRSKPTPQALNEDARTLQLLGELAGREPLWIVAAVQESIEATGDLSQAILRKIKDRYPVRLALSTLHVRALICGRLVRRRPGAEAEIARIHERLRREFSTFTATLEELAATYPLHPATLSLLDGLGDLFSQHRGVVDFVHSRIAGDPRRNIPGILDRPASELLGPDSIYEHFQHRLAEFSSFHAYPRLIVPHFDQTIDRLMENKEDRTLARRLVRTLVLYRIHPTASPPDVSRLAELVSCSLEAPSPGLNVRFVAEAILEPLARESRFLSRSLPASGDPLHAVYTIATEEDPGKVLEARIRACREELAPDDARMLVEPLTQVPESESWPGAAVWGEGAQRLVSWNGSSRRVLVRFLHGEDPKAFADRLAYDIGEQALDCALVLTIEGEAAEADFGSLHAAVWRVPRPAGSEVLREYLATRIVALRLAPASPADLPLIPLAKERLARIGPAAFQAALETFYAGSFSEPRIRLDAAARQLRRFDGLLAAAAEALLAARFPRFSEVAPRGMFPSPRLYQQLFRDFVVPGSLSFADAQARGLAAAIESLAKPLGLVQVRRNAYLLSPDVTDYPLLAFLFSLIKTTEPTPAREVFAGLRGGPFGLPQDTALFLVASLAVAGLLTAARGGRSIPLDFLSLQSIERAEELRLGELIGESDRATLLRECAFLPSVASGETFGLKQQREAWKEVIRFRETARELAERVGKMLSRIAEYSSFRAFPLEKTRRSLAALDVLFQSIAVSLPAREGLEKFLSAWRGTGLSSEDIQLLKKLARFLTEKSEEFVFVSHYVSHPAVEKAASRDPELARLRDSVMALLDSPEASVVGDHGEHLAAAFARLRETYSARYAAAHAAHYQTFEPPALSRSAQRALGLLESLCGVEALDRPPGLDRFLRERASGEQRQCRRQLAEELIRSPLCGCGFVPGDAPAAAAPQKPEELIEEFLRGYCEILASPRVLESLAARAYALRDVEPAAAQRLKRLSQALKADTIGPSRLAAALDAAAVAELGRALAGRIPIHRRRLADLAARLAGRRLTPQKLLAIVSEWLAGTGENELVAVEGELPAASAPPPARTALWPLAHGRLLTRDARAVAASSEEVRAWERELEEAFPAARLAEDFRAQDSRVLLDFIRAERLHTGALRAAWLLIAERLSGGRDETAEALRCAGPPSSAHVDAQIAGDTALRLETAAGLAGRLSAPFPERLSVRLAVERLLADPWSTEELKASLHALLAEVERTAEGWLAGLPPVEPIGLEDSPVVVVVDAASADVWMQALSLAELPAGGAAAWSRLEAASTTHDSLGRLFAVAGDPQEQLGLRGVGIVSLRGTEERSLKERLLPLASGPPVVARLSILDREAHRQALRLSEMARILAEILRRDLGPIAAACAQAGRRLILTSDHGLSLTRDGLTHGRGGVWERAIFRAQWGCPRHGEPPGGS